MFASSELICSIVQATLVLYSIKVWHWRCLLSPGFYFGLIWFLGAVGSMLFFELGIFNIVSEKNVKELYDFVSFTGLSFIFFTWMFRNKVDKNKSIRINLLAKYSWFKATSVIVLIVSLMTFIHAGGSFNMGASRVAMHDNVEEQSVLTGYAQILTLPLSIIAGSLIGNLLQKKIRMSLIDKLFLFLPLLANLMFSIYLGGRVNFAYGIIQYGIGFCLTLKINQSRAISRKIFLIAFVAGVFLSVFISLVAAQRQTVQLGNSNQYDLVARKGILYAVAYGPMEYMNATFVGYQYRRDDAVDLENLGYGKYTFNGFINWTLPFANRYGLGKFSIADILNMRYHNQETYDYRRKNFYYTNSCYIPLVKDFGPKGTYVAIFFIVWIAMHFFIKIQNKKEIKWASSIFLYYLFLEYWMKSNYYGTLSNTIMMLLYGLLLFDLLSYISRKKTQTKTSRRIKILSNN